MITKDDQDAAHSALCAITDDDCRLRGWPLNQLAEHFARYRLAYVDTQRPAEPLQCTCVLSVEHNEPCPACRLTAPSGTGDE